MRDNIITKTDTYKWAHPAMLPLGTTAAWAYGEARKGHQGEEPFDYHSTCWIGLQEIMKKYLEGPRVTKQDLEEAMAIASWHAPKVGFPAREGWERIITKHGGMLPIEIISAPEGLVIPRGNMLYAVTNTDHHPSLAFLPSHLEGLLMKVWYTTAIATKDWFIKPVFIQACVDSGIDPSYADYMLHGFGYRSNSSEESAQRGDGAHLLNFKGTDTIEGMRHVIFYYGAQEPAVSVAASQHEIATALGRTGEFTQQRHVLSQFQNQVVSLVGDSYDYENFVDKMCDERELIDRLNIRLVIRPDSRTVKLRTPKEVVRWTLNRIAARLKHTTTPTGHKVLPYGVLYGDGMEHAEIADITRSVVADGFAASNFLFGEGSGMVQKVDRDLFRFAYKTSALERDGVWYSIAKEPVDASKASKPGRLKLVNGWNGLMTIPVEEKTLADVISQPVFRNGVILRQDTWDTMQERAASAMKRVEVAA